MAAVKAWARGLVIVATLSCATAIPAWAQRTGAAPVEGLEGEARVLPPPQEDTTDTAIAEPNKDRLFGQYGSDPYNYQEATGEPKTEPDLPEPINFRSDLLKVVDPDLTALRFYALIEDEDRFEEEKERIIKILEERGDPRSLAIKAILEGSDWVYPTAVKREECMVAGGPECAQFGLGDAGGGEQAPDERRAWDLAKAGDLDAARAEVQRLQEQYPDYVPNPDLVAEINRRATSGVLQAAVQRNDFQEVVRIANDEQFRSLFGCANINNEWVYADALRRINRREEAFQLYKTLVQTCNNQQERIATIQKANDAGADKDFIRELIAIEARRAQGAQQQQRVAALRRQLLGGGQGSGQPGPTISREGRISRDLGRGRAVSNDDFRYYTQRANRVKDTNAAKTLGFYFYNRRDYENAETWFVRAMDWRADAKAAEGLLLTQRALGRPLLAERIGARWMSAGNVAKAYDDLAVSLFTADSRKRLPDEVLGRLLVRAENSAANPRVPLGAGWYFFNRLQASERQDTQAAANAERWFQFTLGLDDAEDDVIQSAAEGLALMYLSIGNRDRFQQVATFYGGRFPELGKLLAEALATDPGRASEAFSAGEYGACLRELALVEANRQLDAGLHLLKGWCLLGLKRPVEAAFNFERARDSANPQNTDIIQDATYGVALAGLQRGMIDDSLTLAEQAGLSPERLDELRAEGLAQRAVMAFNAKRYEETLRLLEVRAKYARSRRDLLILRAWSLYHLGYPDEAHTLFAVLDEQLTTPETREGIRVVGLRINPPFYD